MRILFILLFLISFKTQAQIVEATPTIPTSEYLNLLADHLELPNELTEKYANQDIELTIILTITKDGTVFNPKIQNDTLQLESSLKKAITNLPKWNPQTKDGNPVVSRKAFKLIILVKRERMDIFVEKEIISQHIMRTFNLPTELHKGYEKKKFVIEFYVQTDGNFSDLKIIESSHPRYNSKIEEAFKKIPKLTKDLPSERIKFPFTINIK